MNEKQNGTSLKHKSQYADTNWNNWQWQMRNRIQTFAELKQWINVTTDEETAIKKCEGTFKWSITPYYASLMNIDNPNCPIRQQAVPSKLEFVHNDFSSIDPVGDIDFRVTNRIVHKYPDRIIILVTEQCPVYCRHCTRKFHTTSFHDTYFGENEKISWDQDFEYIKSHPEIRDVLLTGGDPLSYSDKKLDFILSKIREISHIEIIRIGSRFPVLLPYRITEDLCKILQKNHPIWFNTHFNHETEITPDSEAACDLLLKHGIPIGNQTVLLKGINDSEIAIKNLCHKLVKIRVRPYYLYHCDNVQGVSHFRTEIEVGRKIIRSMIGNTTGFAIPQYVITTKDGKILLHEDNIIEINEENETIKLKNYKGKVTILKGGVKQNKGE